MRDRHRRWDPGFNPLRAAILLGGVAFVASLGSGVATAAVTGILIAAMVFVFSALRARVEVGRLPLIGSWAARNFDVLWATVAGVAVIAFGSVITLQRGIVDALFAVVPAILIIGIWIAVRFYFKRGEPR